MDMLVHTLPFEFVCIYTLAHRVYFTSPVLMGMEASTECLLLHPDLVQIRQELLKASAALMMVFVGQFSPAVRGDYSQDGFF